MLWHGFGGGWGNGNIVAKSVLRGMGLANVIWKGGSNEWRLSAPRDHLGVKVVIIGVNK